MLLAGIKLRYIQASPVNPAIAFAILFWNQTGRNWASAPIFVGSSFGGSALALFFFRFIYQKTTQAIEEIEEEEESVETSSRNEPLMG